MSHTDDPLKCPALGIMVDIYLEPSDDKIHDLVHVLGLDLAGAKPGTPDFIRSEVALILATDSVRQRLLIRELRARITELETQLIEAQVAGGNIDLAGLGVPA